MGEDFFRKIKLGKRVNPFEMIEMRDVRSLGKNKYR